MSELDQNQLVADLARDLVAQMAPQEMPLFRANSVAYFKNPDKALQAKAGKDDTLGFGAGEAMTFLTPVVLAVMTQVVQFIVDEIKKSAKGQGASLINDAVKQVFKKFQPAVPQEKKTPPLTPDQLAQVHKLAFEKGRILKLSEKQAQLLADSVVGSLMLSAA